MFLEILPFLVGAAGICAIGAAMNEVPLLPMLVDQRRIAATRAYASERYGLALTKEQALDLYNGKAIIYQSQVGKEELSLLRPATELATRDLVRHLTVTKGGKNKGPVEVKHEQRLYPELPAYRAAEEKSPKKDKKAPQQDATDLTMRIQQQRVHMAEHPEDVPTFFPVAATQIYDLLDEMVNEINSGIYSIEQQYTIEATVRDYMPTLLQNAIDLPRSFFRNNLQTKPTQAIQHQLNLIFEAIKTIHQVKYANVIRAIDEQGLFLDARFSKPSVEALEIRD